MLLIHLVSSHLFQSNAIHPLYSFHLLSGIAGKAERDVYSNLAGLTLRLARIRRGFFQAQLITLLEKPKVWLQFTQLLFWWSSSNPSPCFPARLNSAITQPFLLHNGLDTPIKGAVKGLRASITLIKLQESFQPLVSCSFRLLAARLLGQKHFVK